MYIARLKILKRLPVADKGLVVLYFRVLNGYNYRAEWLPGVSHVEVLLNLLNQAVTGVTTDNGVVTN